MTHIAQTRAQEDPRESFRSRHYLRHTQRRQEHLASLQLPLVNRSVLEVGAGIGDHTSFFLDRGCEVTVTDGRRENLQVIRQLYPTWDTRLLPLDPPPDEPLVIADVVYCYGLLYHLSEPESALSFMARSCRSLFLLETCVSFGQDLALNPISEPREVPSQAITGCGCRPTRPWVWDRLRSLFEFVYATTTQPWHEEFPLDWRVPCDGLVRAVFVASRDPVESEWLTERLPSRHTRH